MLPAVPSSVSPLSDWLTYAERLHSKTIELGLERVHTVAQRLGLRLDEPVVFTVAGTNGKGSTCAMLESILLQAGYRTGVYSSPHLVHFEERLRILGAPVAASALTPYFAEVEAARLQHTEVPLTYFEFTTLAILWCMQAQRLDAAILEVGMGGRLDAVNIIDADCAIITGIDLDHMEFLGPDRESIGREKAGILRAGRPAIVSDPVPPASVIDRAVAIGADLRRLGRDFNFSGDRQQWVWTGRERRYAGLAYPALRGANQLMNAAGVLAALEALRPRLPVMAQAVRNGLARVQLPGRFQIVPGQPALVLDVAHNVHAVAALAENLDAMGFYPVTHAVFGAMADKALDPILARINPLIDHWYFCDLPTPRAARASALMARWQALNTRAGVSASVHAGPWEALHAAALQAEPADRIVTFGSFFTVGGVLAHGTPRLQAGKPVAVVLT
ncbi:MAG: bifunctional tetrahydrofolate synthase/dihydrofolate synthase [Burkholderiaceae bacterium]|jgi:dihydrofolate synthase/folylpolyglutamate synthase|nr:bifunctional tetrahydrofolate synthase/dihydrofolate synthase [Burkholderiaceae bacterium]